MEIAISNYKKRINDLTTLKASNKYIYIIEIFYKKKLLSLLNKIQN